MKNNIRKIRLSHGLTLETVAQRANTNAAQIQKLEKGERRLTLDWVNRLASALHVSAQEVLGAGEKIMIPVRSFVGAGAKIYPIGDDVVLDMVECPPDADPATTVALRVTGDSMLPFIKSGWTVYYDGESSLFLDKMLGELCVVCTDDGACYVKVLKLGKEKNRFDLHSYNPEERILTGVKLTSCHKITFIKPA